MLDERDHRSLVHRLDLLHVQDEAPGSLERFAGLLLEHHRGRLPAWLAPVQVRILPVETGSHEYGDALLRALASAGFRAEVDARDESLARRVRSAHEAAIPVIAVAGERERRSGTVTLRGPAGAETLPVEQAVGRLSSLFAPPAFAW